jgi:hypothetical protein
VFTCRQAVPCGSRSVAHRRPPAQRLRRGVAALHHYKRTLNRGRAPRWRPLTKNICVAGGDADRKPSLAPRGRFVPQHRANSPHFTANSGRLFSSESPSQRPTSRSSCCTRGFTGKRLSPPLGATLRCRCSASTAGHVPEPGARSPAAAHRPGQSSFCYTCASLSALGRGVGAHPRNGASHRSVRQTSRQSRGATVGELIC